MTTKQWTPPATPREWIITIDHPRSNTMASLLAGDPSARMTDAEADEYARNLPGIPDGWEVVSTAQISKGKRGPILPTDSRQLRIVLHPVEWRERYAMRAPQAVYAAAQYVGMRTHLDAVMRADADGIQHFSPSGQPVQRHCTRWQDDLPNEIREALSVVEYVCQRERVGYMWGRPNADRAKIAADTERDADADRSASAIDTVRQWIRLHYPTIEV